MRQEEKGFTLIEILLVVAAIVILAGIVIVAVNPAQQLADTRNAERQSNVNAILSATQQYRIDNGQVPDALEEAATTTPEECADQDEIELGADIDIEDDLTPQYLSVLPEDPLEGGDNGIGYHIGLTDAGRIVVCAPYTENVDEGDEIVVTQ